MLIEFDAPIDEIVDASMRMARSTRTYQRHRLTWQLVLAAVLLFPMLRAILETPDSSASAQLLVVCLGVPTVVLAAWSYGLFTDWYTARSYRGMIREMYGGAGQVHYIVEIRDDGLWTSSNGLQNVFPWSNFVRLEDGGEDVELWFNPGLIVLRPRVFADPAERRLFLDKVRAALLPGQAA